MARQRHALCDLNKLWRATGYSKALRRLAGANAAAATAVKAVTGEFPEGSIALIAFVADRMSYADYGGFPVADAESAHRYIAPMVSCGNVTPDKPPVHAGGLFRFRSDMIGIFTLGRGLLVARGRGRWFGLRSDRDRRRCRWWLSRRYRRGLLAA